MEKKSGKPPKPLRLLVNLFNKTKGKGNGSKNGNGNGAAENTTARARDRNDNGKYSHRMNRCPVPWPTYWETPVPVESISVQGYYEWSFKPITST